MENESVVTMKEFAVASAKMILDNSKAVKRLSTAVICLSVAGCLMWLKIESLNRRIKAAEEQAK